LTLSRCDGQALLTGRESAKSDSSFEFRPSRVPWQLLQDGNLTLSRCKGAADLSKVLGDPTRTMLIVRRPAAILRWNWATLVDVNMKDLTGVSHWASFGLRVGDGGSFFSATLPSHDSSDFAFGKINYGGLCTLWLTGTVSRNKEEANVECHMSDGHHALSRAFEVCNLVDMYDPFVTAFSLSHIYYVWCATSWSLPCPMSQKPKNYVSESH
jgi:hypothetical protein